MGGSGSQAEGGKVEQPDLEEITGVVTRIREGSLGTFISLYEKSPGFNLTYQVLTIQDDRKRDIRLVVAPPTALEPGDLVKCSYRATPDGPYTYDIIIQHFHHSYHESMRTPSGRIKGAAGLIVTIEVVAAGFQQGPF